MSGTLRLGIDTSGGRTVATVALARGALPLACHPFSGAQQSESILGSIRELLAAADFPQAGERADCAAGTVRLRDLEEIVLTIGPGSFTGMRTALATAAGLAWERQLPVIGVSNLLLPFAEHGGEGDLIALVQCAADEWFAVAGSLRTTSTDLRASGEADHRTLTLLTPVILMGSAAIEPLTAALAAVREGKPVTASSRPDQGAELALRAAQLEVVSSSPLVPPEALRAIPGVHGLLELTLLQRSAGGAEITLLYGKGANARTLVERGVAPRGELP